jgi:hypothetical protein
LVAPELVEPASLATALRRAATVLRTLELVVLKYSLNLTNTVNMLEPRVPWDVYILGGRARSGGSGGSVCEADSVLESLLKCRLPASIGASLTRAAVERLDGLSHTGCLDTIDLDLEIVGAVRNIASDLAINDDRNLTNRAKSQRTSARQVSGGGNVKFILEGLSCSKRGERLRAETVEDEAALDSLESDLSIL